MIDPILHRLQCGNIVTQEACSEIQYAESYAILY